MNRSSSLYLMRTIQSDIRNSKNRYYARSISAYTHIYACADKYFSRFKSDRPKNYYWRRETGRYRHFNQGKRCNIINTAGYNFYSNSNKGNILRVRHGM